MSVDNSRLMAWQAMQDARRYGQQGELNLYGSGGPTGMDPTPSWKDYVDAKDEAVESRMRHDMANLATASQMRNNIWGAAAAILGVILTILAFGGDRFDGGVGVGATFAEKAEVQALKDKDQDAKLELIDQKLDVLIKQTATR